MKMLRLVLLVIAISLTANAAKDYPDPENYGCHPTQCRSLSTAFDRCCREFALDDATKMPECLPIPGEDSDTPCLDLDWVDNDDKGEYGDVYCKCVYTVGTYENCVHKDDKFCGGGLLWLWIVLIVVGVVLVGGVVVYFFVLKKDDGDADDDDE